MLISMGWKRVNKNQFTLPAISKIRNYGQQNFFMQSAEQEDLHSEQSFPVFICALRM
jgi:hypothetical protein